MRVRFPFNSSDHFSNFFLKSYWPFVVYERLQTLGELISTDPGRSRPLPLNGSRHSSTSEDQTSQRTGEANSWQNQEASLLTCQHDREGEFSLQHPVGRWISPSESPVDVPAFKRKNREATPFSLHEYLWKKQEVFLKLDFKTRCTFLQEIHRAVNYSLPTFF